MTSRDAILQRIRVELAEEPSVDPPPVPEVWPRTDPSTEQLVDRFSSELEAVQGELVRCGSMEEARRRLAELIDQSQWKTLGSVDRPICRELAARPFGGTCFTCPSDGKASDRVAWAKDGWEAKQMAELSAGLVAADCLLADTGTCMIACDTAEERLMCYLPPACVVIARSDQLVEHMPAAWAEIARRTADPKRRGEFVFITGPSRTADIEKILILGVHGPKRLVVILAG